MDQKHIKIELTDEQKAEIQKNSGKSVDAIELSVEELEQRIAPRSLDVF
jgi:uncharacterized small protein (DUF1192 family)